MALFTAWPEIERCCTDSDGAIEGLYQAGGNKNDVINYITEHRKICRWFAAHGTWKGGHKPVGGPIDAKTKAY